ncbi:MAG: transcriptional repressor [Armatimonadota bacterium]|nr:transcriptional repressor [Armatimonadota bacterium]
MSNCEDLRDTVHEHGGRMTRQRRVVLETLASVDAHPTAAELHEMVRQRLPGISQGTVYRNLRRLQELGYVQELDYGAGASHFDARVEPHYHVRCLRCGRVEDLELDVEPRPDVDQAAQAATDWQIDGHRVEFVGLCPECRGTDEREDRGGG